MLTDHNAERQYLGAALTDESVLDRFPVSPIDFERRSHAIVYTAIVLLHSQKQTVDLVTVISELERSGQLRAVGDHDGVYACIAAPEAPVEVLQGRLRDLGRLRTMREQLMRAVVRCEQYDASGALDVVNEISEAETSAKHRRIYSAAELVEDTVEHLGLYRESSPTKLIPTGIAALDAEIGGLEAGDMLTFGAQTNVGKSWMALSCAHEIARQGYRAGIVSLEDPARLWGSRMLSMLSDVASKDLRSKRLDVKAYDQLNTARQRARDLGVELATATGATVHEVVDTMRVLVRERGCHVVMVDYAQCLHGVTASSDHQALKRMVTMVKTAAERLGVPLVLFSQIKRGDNPDREPTKYDLKEGGDLEIKSEYVVMLWREKVADGLSRSVLQGKLDKSKVGGNGTELTWKQLASGALVEDGPAARAIPREPPRSNLYDLSWKRGPFSGGEGGTE